MLKKIETAFTQKGIKALQPIKDRCEYLLDATGDTEKPLYLLAYIYFLIGNFEKSKTFYTTFLKKFPQSKNIGFVKKQLKLIIKKIKDKNIEILESNREIDTDEKASIKFENNQYVYTGKTKDAKVEKQLKQLNAKVKFKPEKEKEIQGRERVFNYIEKNLPSLPQVVRRIINEVQSPHSNFGRLVDIMKQDPFFMTKIMKFAAIDSGRKYEEIRTIERAIEVLGFNRIKSICLSTSVFYIVDKQKKSVDFNMENFWKHSLATALLAKLIAKLKGYDEEEYFGAGLVHDIGKTFIAIIYPDKFSDYIREYNEEITGIDIFNHVKMRNLELKHFNIDHSTIGKLICTHWNLPSLFIDSIEYHNKEYRGLSKKNAEEKERDNARHMIRIADATSKLIMLENSSLKLRLMKQIITEMEKWLDIDNEEAYGLLEKVSEMLPSISKEMEIDIGVDVQSLLMDLLRIQSQFVQEIVERPSAIDYFDNKEEFLPYPVSLQYKYMKNALNLREKLDGFGNTLELYVIILANVLYPYALANQLETRAATLYKESMKRMKTIGAWESIISQILVSARKSKHLGKLLILEQTEKDVSLIRKYSQALVQIRNQIVHGRSDKKQTADEVDNILMMLNLFIDKFPFFLENELFFVISTKLLRGQTKKKYIIKKWHGTDSMDIAKPHEIMSAIDMYEDQDIYIYNKKSRVIFPTYPFLLRSDCRHPDCQDTHVYYLAKYSSSKKTGYYISLEKGHDMKNEIEEKLLYPEI